jgi:hypothetical protein
MNTYITVKSEWYHPVLYLSSKKNYVTVVMTVRELMGRVRNVVLIKCILDLGNPRGVGILGGRAHGPGEEKGSWFTSNLRPRWTIPVTARRVPSK